MLWKTTPHGVEVTILGRWLGRDTEIFVSLKYDGRTSAMRLIASEDSYMKGFRGEDKDFENSPVTKLRASYSETEEDSGWEIEIMKCDNYTRAQKKLIPELFKQILPHLPLSTVEHLKIHNLYQAYDVASIALSQKRRFESIKRESEENMSNAKKLLSLDELGIETLVTLVEEGGDLVILAQNMDALLR